MNDGRWGGAAPRSGGRLAVSGSAGVGKSTLARALATELGLPYLEEGMRRRLEGGLDLHLLSREDMRRLFDELWAEKEAEERDAVARRGGFVADRTSVDFAAFWLYYGFTDEEDRPGPFLERMTAWGAEAYDAVVVLPWGGIPLVADGVRSPSRWKQLHLQRLIEGLLWRHVPADRLFTVPEPVAGLEERLCWVRARVPGAGPPRSG